MMSVCNNCNYCHCCPEEPLYLGPSTKLNRMLDAVSVSCGGQPSRCERYRTLENLERKIAEDGVTEFGKSLDPPILIPYIK